MLLKQSVNCPGIRIMCGFWTSTLNEYFLCAIRFEQLHIGERYLKHVQIKAVRCGRVCSLWCVRLNMMRGFCHGRSVNIQTPKFASSLASSVWISFIAMKVAGVIVNVAAFPFLRKSNSVPIRQTDIKLLHELGGDFGQLLRLKLIITRIGQFFAQLTILILKLQGIYWWSSK